MKKIINHIKLEVIKKDHFSFNEIDNMACIYLRKTYSNIFVTLADRNFKPIICITSGKASSELKSKRRKRAPYAFEHIVKELMVYIKLYSIKSVWIYLKMRVNTFFYFLVKELSFYGINVAKFSVRRSVAFMVLEVKNYEDYKLYAIKSC